MGDVANIHSSLEVGQKVKIFLSSKEITTIIRGWRADDVILVDVPSQISKLKTNTGIPCEVKFLRQGVYHRFKSQIFEVIKTSQSTQFLTLKFPEKISIQSLRSFPRIKTYLAGTLLDSKDESWPCTVMDLSLGGFLAEITELSLDPGDHFRLYCVLPTQNSVDGVECIVRRECGDHRYGFEFNKLNGKDKDALEDFFMIFTEIQSADTAAGVKRGMMGDIGEIPLCDLLQILVSSRKSYQLDIQNGSNRARVYVRDGEILSATSEDRTGVDALSDVFSWSRGRYHIQGAEWIPTRNIEARFEYLLLEVARRQDQRKQVSKIS